MTWDDHERCFRCNGCMPDCWDRAEDDNGDPVVRPEEDCVCLDGPLEVQPERIQIWHRGWANEPTTEADESALAEMHRRVNAERVSCAARGCARCARLMRLYHLSD